MNEVLKVAWKLEVLCIVVYIQVYIEKFDFKVKK